MPRQVVNVTVDADGNVFYEVVETVGGPTCRTSMEPLIEALGGDENPTPKPEWQQGVQEPHVLRNAGPQQVQSSI